MSETKLNPWTMALNGVANALLIAEEQGRERGFEEGRKQGAKDALACQVPAPPPPNAIKDAYEKANLVSWDETQDVECGQCWEGKKPGSRTRYVCSGQCGKTTVLPMQQGAAPLSSPFLLSRRPIKTPWGLFDAKTGTFPAS